MRSVFLAYGTCKGQSSCFWRILPCAVRFKARTPGCNESLQVRQNSPAVSYIFTDKSCGVATNTDKGRELLWPRLSHGSTKDTPYTSHRPGEKQKVIHPQNDLNNKTFVIKMEKTTSYSSGWFVMGL
ncbi:hypothetical protein NPIL_617511 [Nephila pilipes]|uniref:Uncharacterized protein n=1 Tax=Nephila pilipes TaxID=299642 RepID=A0A8X6T9K6_NEPPI|nr:hypothetical protein NPIL_617511 [Nephila pilipes]